MLRVEAAIFAPKNPSRARRWSASQQSLPVRRSDRRSHPRTARPPLRFTLVTSGCALHTKTHSAPAIRAAHPDLGRDDVAGLARTETFALTAIAYMQPVTRAEISRLAGREISRDMIASLKRHGLINRPSAPLNPAPPFPM